MKPILEIQNISKKFRINLEQQPYLSLRDSLVGIFKNKSSKEDFWALKDVSFDVKPGDTVGIIGKNGAGKSTLLKILSKITPPTSGKIISRGRIASLLEVGTGFHPELSGRENVFMNGSILGMRRVEIQKNFDAIVDFAGVEKFIDTPLKHYSSGMQLRLAFAVAAFLENEILIIDEVLAVGDAEFQKKCLGKMGDISQSGRTILFVSHDMGAIQSLCTHGLLIEKGKILFDGSITDSINKYVESRTFVDSGIANVRLRSDEFSVTPMVYDKNLTTKSAFRSGEDVIIDLVIRAEKEINFKNYAFELKIMDNLGNVISVVSTYLSFFIIDKTEKKIIIRTAINALNLMKGMYSINLVVVDCNDTSKVFTAENFIIIEIIDALQFNIIRDINTKYHGNVALKSTWSLV